MKRIFFVFIVITGIIVSCTEKFEDFNTDQKNPTEVPGNFVFANAQVALGDQISSANVNLNILRLVAQYWTETTYIDEANYDLVNRTIPDLVYRTYYRDILNDLRDAKRVIAKEETVSDDDAMAKENRLQIIELLEIYCWNELVDYFGNIPYTEALDIENTAPAYDDAMTIYKDLISRIDIAILALDPDYGSFGSADLYMGGDVASWIKFGYSMKVKLAINLADVDNAYAKAAVEAAYANAFGPNEICALAYTGTSNPNGVYVDLVQSGRHDFVPANTIVDIMNTLNDPRRAAYFTLYEGAYLGGQYGYSNNFSSYSHISDAIQEPDYPMTILDGTEIAFYLAEAAARGYSVGGTAEALYASAISSSFAFWGLSQGEADTYIASAGVAYNAADWKELIGTQAWIAYYNRGMQGWTSWRRLDFPTLNIPEAPMTEDGQVPKRFTYPVNEQTLNEANYKSASIAIGGDVMHNKLFWDVN
jgi:hypothetical protein